MSGVLGLVQLSALAAIGFAGLLAGAFLAVRPRTLRVLRGVPPRQRAAVLTGLALTPLAGSALLVGVCFLPSTLDLLGLRDDHCIHHGHHAHLCLAHPPADAGPLAGWIVLGLAGGALLWGAARLVVQAAVTSRMLRTLSDTGTLDPSSGVRWIDGGRPVSMAVGLGRCEVVVSRALADALPDPLLAAVVEHERAHLRRGDALRLLVARIGSILHLPAVRDVLLAELALACEQACDDAATEATGDRLGVAEAILRVERLSGPMPAPAVGLGMHGSDVPARVRRLLGAPDEIDPRRARLVVATAIAVLGGTAVLAAEPLHHIAETALALIG